MKRYAQVTEADEREAAKMILLNQAEKSVQNKVQTTAERSCKDSHEHDKEYAVIPYNCESKRQFAAQCKRVQKVGISTKQDDKDYFEDYTMQRAGHATGFGLF